MRGIWERRYYTNHGPLAQELEAALARFLKVKHVVCVTNATIGLMMAAEALALKGKVIMPSHTFIATAQSLRWCGLQPVFCDVEPSNHQIDPQRVAELIDDDVSAILAVNLWGGACDVASLEVLARNNNLALYFDSSQAFGCAIDDVPLARFGQAEVFSFHATKVLSAAEGWLRDNKQRRSCCSASQHPKQLWRRKATQVVKTSNGRISEAQAAIALMSLDDYPSIQAKNRALFDAYSRNLADIAGIRIVHPSNVTTSNYQYAVCEIDEDVFGISRDQLLRLLHAENVIARRYFYPGTHRCEGFSESADIDATRLYVTERLCRVGFQLPLGSRVSEESVSKICTLIARAHEQASEIRPLIAKDF